MSELLLAAQHENYHRFYFLLSPSFSTRELMKLFYCAFIIKLRLFYVILYRISLYANEPSVQQLQKKKAFKLCSVRARVLEKLLRCSAHISVGSDPHLSSQIYTRGTCIYVHIFIIKAKSTQQLVFFKKECIQHTRAKWRVNEIIFRELQNNIVQQVCTWKISVIQREKERFWGNYLAILG